MDVSGAVSLPAPWAGRWISPADLDQDAEHRPAHLLSRRFPLDRRPRRAVLHATALGIYEVFLNGRRVGDHELAPGSTAYHKTLYAQSFDVTNLVTPGENLIQVLLSDGWFRGRNGGMQRRDSWGDTTGLLIELVVDTDSGTERIVSDETWESQPSWIVRADLMRGQASDLSAVLAPAKPVRVDAVSGPTPTRSPAPPVRRIRTLPPLSVTRPRPGVTVIDFGTNISGWVRLRDLGREGDRTELVHGEHLDAEGDLDTAHLDIHTPAGEHIPCRQVDEVIAGARDSVFEPRHTVHGFRYVRVHHPGRDLDPACIEAVEVRTDLTSTSSFQCSDAAVNELHEMARRTFLANAVDVPTDCPTRERAAWTGDFQVFTPLAATLFDISGFASKWLTSLRDDQFADGCLPMYAPDADRMAIHPEHPSRHGGGSAGWGDAAVEVPRTIFEHYGDERVLIENWDLMNSWVEFALRAAREKRHRSRAGTPEAAHERYLWDGTFHFGEWLEPRSSDAPPVDPAASYHALLAADQGEVGTAYLFRSVSQLSRIAALLGHHERAHELDRVAHQVRDAWVTEYLDRATGRTRLDTQAGYVRALAFDLVPADLRDRAAERLVQLIDAADLHLATGFLSTGLLLSTLADAGHTDVAFSLLQQTSTPSWRGMLERGATTYWENWDGVDASGVARRGSLNHYSKGAAMRFLYTHVLGLGQAVGSSGWEHVTIRPHIGGGITSAAGHIDTVRGRIDVAWELVDDQFSMTLILPDDVRGVVTLPDESHLTVGPGRHDLRAWILSPHDSATPLRSHR